MQPQSRPARRRGQGSLYTRADKSGLETWYGKWRTADGRQVKRALGPKRSRLEPKGLTETQAEKKLRELSVTYEPPEAPAEDCETVTVRQAAREHIDKRVRARGRKPSTVEHYESLLRTHIAPFMGDRSVTEITRRDVEALMSHMAKPKPSGIEGEAARAGASPKTVRLALGFLHSVFDYARREGWIETNPCADADKPHVPPTTEIRFLTVEEVQALLRVMPTFASEQAKRERNAALPEGIEPEPEDYLGPVERALYMTAAMTGLRQGELRALRWRDVDFAAELIRVVRSYSRHRDKRDPFSSPKSGRARSVPLAPEVAAVLDELSRHSSGAADDDLVFAHPRTGRPMDGSKITKRFKGALKRAGLRELRFHDLRHTFGTTLAGRDVAVTTIQVWMGHRDLTTTQIYLHHKPSKRDAELIGEAFRSESPTPPIPARGVEGVDRLTR